MAQKYDVLSASPRATHARLLGHAETLAEADCLIRQHVPREICGAVLIGAALLTYPDLDGRTVYEPRWRDPAWIYAS